VCVIHASNSSYGLLFPSIRKRKKDPLVHVLASGRARKSTKMPLRYAWLAVKPDNMLSSIGNSVGKKEGWLHEPLTLHRVLDIYEWEEDAPLVFFNQSTRHKKRAA